MTALLEFIKVAWPYILVASLGMYGGYRLESADKEVLQAKFDLYQSQVAQANADAQRASSDALEAQIQTRLQTEANNGKIIQQLQSQRDGAMADRDFARRLLAAAQAESTASGGAVPKTADRPGAPSAPGNGSDQPLADEVGDAAIECRDAIERFAAAQAQLIPQLRAQ